jgi:hypothetical protein
VAATPGRIQAGPAGEGADERRWYGHRLLRAAGKKEDRTLVLRVLSSFFPSFFPAAFDDLHEMDALFPGEQVGLP